jgi:hypothetical protein
MVSVAPAPKPTWEVGEIPVIVESKDHVTLDFA